MNKVDVKLFEEMKTLINEQNEENFLFFISKNEYLLKIDPILFIANHVSFYAVREDISKAIEVVTYYKNKPYISMKVEDFLNELYEELTSLNKEKSKNYSIDKLKEMLFSNNEETRTSALSFLSKQNIRNYLSLIQEYLLLDIPYKFKTLALFILVEQKVSIDIKVLKNDKIYTYNPSFLKLPFEDDIYKYCKKSILLLETERVDVVNLAIELLNTLQIKMFPDSLITIDYYALYAEILLDMASILLGEDSKIDEIVTKFSYDLDEIMAKIDELNKIIMN